MSERLAVLLAALALLCPGVLPAQDTAALRLRLDVLQARMDSLRSTVLERQQAERQALELDLLEPLDTARVGPFTVITPERDPALAADFRVAWAGLEDIVGDVAPRIRAHTFLVSGWRRVPVFEAMMPRPAHRAVRPRSLFGGPDGVARARAAMGESLSGLVPTDLRRWAGAAFFRGPTDWSRVYRMLATSAAPAGRACFGGDEAACVAALLETEPARFTGHTSDRMRSLPVPARTALVQLALRRGGAGAFERLVQETPHATFQQRLERVAGIPFAQLAHEWRSAAFRDRPRARAGLGLSLLGTLLGSALLLFLATRSTRCRAG